MMGWIRYIANVSLPTGVKNSDPKSDLKGLRRPRYIATKGKNTAIMKRGRLRLRYNELHHWGQIQ